MQAHAPELPLAADRQAIQPTPPRQPAADSFQTLFQGRLVAHILSRPRHPATSGPRDIREAPLKADNFLAGRAQRAPKPKDRRLPPELLPQLAVLLIQAGLPTERVQALLSDPRVQEQGLSLAELKRLWQEARGTAAKLYQAAPVQGQALPPVLVHLMEALQQSPGGTLPLPASRWPEITARLLAAGFSPDRVEALLDSPRVQENGLTAELARQAWQKAAQELGGQGSAPSPEAWLKFTSRADYQQIWERLRLPLEALPDLRLALLQLGASPEVLARLEEQATPEGLPVGQVWQVIKQCLAASGNDSQAASASGGLTYQELKQWRQLLLKAGFAPEVVDTLLGKQPPASLRELQARLVALAPTNQPPESREGPKPLYLPADLRFQPWWGETDSEAGVGADSGDNQSSGYGNLEHRMSSPSPANPVAFSAWLARLAAAASGDFPGDYGWLWRPEVRQSFWTQLEAGLLGNLRPGESRLTLSLEPPHLGQIGLLLRLQGNTLAVTATLSRPEVAYLAQIGVEHLSQALARHGLMLSRFEVQLPESWPLSTGLLTAVEKAFAKKGQGPDGRATPRRRRAEPVDRFV
ncbi:MAG: flagellar hook-length control protein FliK [Deltaproteobacteria bacterium]|nr:flagellar hook-length control protein FliK [Deltaproteobacteria bacterium]